MIWVLCNIHFDGGLLPRFLRYYRQRGVDQFGIITHGDFKSEQLNGRDIITRHVEEPYKGGPVDNELLQNFKNHLLSPGDWYIPADVDEFYWTPALYHFEHLTGDWDYIPAKFVDRLPFDGVIKPLTKESLDIQCPLGSSLTSRLCCGCEDKIAMAKWNIDTNSGHHYALSGKRAPFTVQMHHFKWFSEIIWRWAQYKARFYKSEVDFFRDHYQIHGRINVYHEGLNVFDAPPIGI